MRSLALCALVVAALALLAPTSSGQQVTQVPGTGCSTSTYPSFSGPPRIGQPFSFSYACAYSNRLAFAFLGTPSSSGGVSFYAPFTCDAGPCVWHVAPLGGVYYGFPAQVASGTWWVNIPNAPQLVGSAWALQCVCKCT